MKPFPGELGKEKRGSRWFLVLNEDQKTWFVKWFPVTENRRIGKAMGVCISTVQKFASELHLAKSEVGMKAIKRRQTAAMLKANIRNGCYDRKRGHPVSEATMAGNRRRWEEQRLGIREDAAAKMKRENPKKYAEWMRKKSEERKELIRKERQRAIYGLRRETKLIAVVLNKYTRRQIAHRHNALEKGYLLDENCREGQPGRYVIYYDEKTRRSERFEKNCIEDGFTFQHD